MEKEQRTRLQKATQDARRLLEEEFRSQLLQTYDIDVQKVRWAEEPGAHLLAEQRLIREKLIAWIEHKEAQINDRKEALLLALREMAFTALNRFVALKLMEARELVRPCVTGGLESVGFQEFTAVAQGLLADQESSYRLYLETIFEDVSCELRALFDPRDPASLLWPKRTALLELLEILNRPELAELWREDETLGWVYQYFNGDAERKKMREESAAPRNSRELAVRNQFFTPRYVVEFLTDNTLGRIWYEMRQGNTRLKDRCRYLVRRPNETWLQPREEPPSQSNTDDAFSQQELLRQPMHIPHRPLKDPREIRMLDPACGSMHFGLYAFDLYLEIYEEAWDIAQSSGEQARKDEAFTAFIDYTAGFQSKTDFLRETPKLILKHNIYGIDIDPRATQIARLTLWMRAQRAWQEQQLQIAERPSISRSNVLCAEPMPGELELLADFVDQQFQDKERGLVQQLLQVIFDKMQLTGEAGSLLKIEEEIRDAIDEARREWQRLAIQQQDLFSADELASLGQLGSSADPGLQQLTKDFWVDIEDRVYASLRHYAEHAEAIGGFQRRLFAEDAAQGFAFIDACRKQFDVILMNPPFGDPSKPAIRYLQKSYVAPKHDIASAFIERSLSLLDSSGIAGCISTRTIFYLSYLAEWRHRTMLELSSIRIFCDCGFGVLDAIVETALSVFSNANSSRNSSLFIRAINQDTRAQDLLEGRDSIEHMSPTPNVFTCFADTFELMPRAPFVYWVPDDVKRLFSSHPKYESGGRFGAIGALTQDDFRFTRARWEIDPTLSARTWTKDNLSRWVIYSNGGSHTPVYADPVLYLNWFNDGAELKEFLSSYRRSKGFSAQWTSQLNAYDKYFKPAMTWSSRPSSQGSFWILGEGGIFGNSGPAVFCDSEEDFFWTLGIANSRIYRALLGLLMPRGGSGEQTLKYELGYVRSVPIPDPPEAIKAEVSSLIQDTYFRLKLVSSYDETSHFFVGPGVVAVSGTGEVHDEVDEIIDGASQALGNSFDRIDEIAEQQYGLDHCDREKLYANSSVKPVRSNMNLNPILRLAEEAPWPQRIVSYALGVLVGRWDIRIGERQARNQTNAIALNPFSPLPKTPPGMFLGSEAPLLSTNDEPVPIKESGYPAEQFRDGILVDDLGHVRDIQGQINQVLDLLLGADSEVVRQLAIKKLGASSLREWLRRPACFFADHLKRYSQGRRQAPIYWLLSAGGGSYSAWLYFHAFTRDTLYRLLRDFVDPRIQQAEREQFELGSQGALSGDAAARLQEAQTLLQDLRILRSELDLVAPLWNPNHNDGVIINHAILWRITPYAPWQKKCKECWDKLVKGDYDWAHLAFHLWPERVIPKCTTDRSLAIAHGLEERLWQETNNGNWLPRQLSETDLQALIAEHSNPAVKSALERFLAAPPPAAPTRTRASRGTRSSGSSASRRPRGTAAVVDAEATRQVLLALTAAPSDGLAKAAIADLIGVEANALTAVIKQLKESDQIDQLGERRGARYVLSEQGRAAVASETEVEA